MMAKFSHLPVQFQVGLFESFGTIVLQFCQIAFDLSGIYLRGNNNDVLLACAEHLLSFNMYYFTGDVLEVFPLSAVPSLRPLPR